MENNEEVIHLQNTLDKVQQAKFNLDSQMLAMGSENLDTLKDLRQNPETSGADFFFFLEQLHEKNQAFNFRDKYKRLDEFESMLNEPYFSGLTLLNPETKTPEDIYIGKFGYTADKPVIIDWRAKIASIYYRYRYPQKNVSYDTEFGQEHRDLLLKRTFEIDKGNLIKYYNNDIQLDESQIISDKIAKRTGGVLEDIVETIQEAQLDIIESDPRQICIVQGCVGSGKSTVAIHKLSHIFFNFPNLIHPERSILIAKNQILVGYLSTLFPKLGIFDINYKSLRDLIINAVFREELGTKVNFDKEAKLEIFGFLDIKKVADEILLIHEKYKQKIDILFAEIQFESFGGFKYNTKDTVYENLCDVIDDMEEELKLEIEMLKESPDSPRSWLYKENIRELKKLLTTLKKLRTDVKETTLLELLKKYNLHKSELLGYEETLKYLVIYVQLIGFKNTIKYEYCIVDEGQDFSQLEYYILGKMVLNGRFCILGDLNQLYVENGLTSWEDISNVIVDAKNANTYTLDTNYRSTKPIIDLANKILRPYTGNYLPKSINRKGPAPTITNLGTDAEMLEAVKNELIVETKDLSKSIGIICFTEHQFVAVQAMLAELEIDKDKLVTLDSTKKIAYIPKGIYLSRFEDCKGLEFAKVCVVGLNLDELKTFVDAKKAFVAVTRAMNELTVFGTINK